MIEWDLSNIIIILAKEYSHFKGSAASSIVDDSNRTTVYQVKVDSDSVVNSVDTSN